MNFTKAAGCVEFGKEKMVPLKGQSALLLSLSLFSSNLGIKKGLDDKAIETKVSELVKENGL